MLVLLALLPVLGRAALFKSRGAVVKLDATNFTPLVLTQRNPFVVFFYSEACPHCAKVAPAFTKAAEQLQRDGVSVSLGALDATKYWDIGQHYKITGYPWVKAFCPDESEVDMTGLGTDPSGIVEFAKKQVKDCPRDEEYDRVVQAEFQLGPAIAVTEASSFLGGAHVSSGGAQIAVLLLAGAGEEEEKAPSWLTSVAMEYKKSRGVKKVAFAFAPPSVSAKVAARLGLRTDWLPKLVAVSTVVAAAGDGDGGISPESASVTQEFALFPGNLGGDRKARHIKQPLIDWIARFAGGGGGGEGQRGALPEELRVPLEELRRARAVTAERLGGNGRASAAAAVKAAGPTVQVQELAPGMPLAVPGSKQMRVVVVPHPHSKARDLAAARALADRFAKDRRDPFSFVSLGLESEESRAFLAAFGVADGPAVVVLKTKPRLRFVAWQGSSSGDSDGAAGEAKSAAGLREGDVAAFLDGVLGGSAHFTTLAALPELRETPRNNEEAEL